MNYYKILNEEESHHNLQYKTGLNIDPYPFNPSGDCQPGGIYFASNDILAFLEYGPWIRKVTLLEDTQVYENPGRPKKWKANKVLLGERRRINIEVIQELLNEGADPKIKTLQWAARNGYLEIVKLLIPISNSKLDNSYALQWAAMKGHLEIVKLLIDSGADPNMNNSHALRWAVGNGHLDIIKLLIENGADPKAHSGHALQLAAKDGYLEIVKLLIDNKVDPKASNNYALQLAIENEHIEVVKLLIPVSIISNKIKHHSIYNCKNQEIRDLILNHR